MQDMPPPEPELPPWWLAIIACGVLSIAAGIVWIVWGIAA